MKNIKILFLAIGLAIGLTSCEKDEVLDCSCGYIVDDGIETVNGQNYYWLGIENDCSENYAIYYFSFNDWLDGHPGNHFCVTGESWKK